MILSWSEGPFSHLFSYRHHKCLVRDSGLIISVKENSLSKFDTTFVYVTVIRRWCPNTGNIKKIPFRSFLLSWKGPSPIRIQCLEVIDKTCPALFSFFFNPWRISSGDKNLKIKLTLDFCYSSTIVGTFVHRFPLFFWVDKCYTMCGFYNYPRATAVTNFFTFLNGK